MTHLVWPIEPRSYRRHSLHVDDRAWGESNCYIDLWIEMLHTAGHEPLAALPFTIAIDIEADQWTFLKFPANDLHHLYGVEIVELNVWRPLVTHLDRLLTLGRAAIAEVDAF